MRARSIVVLLVLVTLGALGGCKIDSRSLTPPPPGSGGSAAAGHGSSGVPTGLGGVRGSGGSAGSGASTGSGGATLPTILLGNFEDDTALPQDSRFANYQYYAYNPSAPGLPLGDFLSSPIVSPGFDSNFALGLNWEVIDPLDGTPNYPGVGVRTVVSTGFVDLSGYDRIVFAQQYQHTGSCQPIQALTVVIGCDELNTSYIGAVAVSPTWTNSSLSFSSLTEPSFLPPSGYTRAQCLAVANRVDFQAQVNLADGDCASGNLALDNIEIRAGGGAGQDGGVDSGPSAGIPISPDGNGRFDGSNAAGVAGAWSSTGDDYGADGTPGTGDCPKDGFAQAQCSTIAAPTPGKPFAPDSSGRMCTSGIAAQVINDGSGQPAYSYIWGNFIFFDLNQPPASTGDGGADASAGDGGLDAGTGVGFYDAPARGITGFAFDLEGTAGPLRVEFPTLGTETNAAYWAGALDNTSPVSGPGHYEIRWTDVGGPQYLASPPPFDPTKLESIRFHVVSNTSSPTSYSFCIKNTVMLTAP